MHVNDRLAAQTPKEAMNRVHNLGVEASHSKD